MNFIQPKSDACNLATRHRIACVDQASAEEILAMFCQDHWFIGQLNKTSNRIARRLGLPRDAVDDIRQEALLRLARLLSKNTSLGYRSTRGSYPAFLSRLILRCCQHGSRHLNDRYRQREELNENVLETETRIHSDDLIDLRNLLAEISEPQQTALRQKLDGWSLGEIAEDQAKSKRTVSRWINQALDQIQNRYESSPPRRKGPTSQ